MQITLLSRHEIETTRFLAGFLSRKPVIFRRSQIRNHLFSAMPRSLDSPITRSNAFLLIFLVSFAWVACKDSVSPRIYPPELSAPAHMGAIVDREFTQPLQVSDPQGLDVDLTFLGLPAWLEYFPGQYLLQGTPGEQDVGSFDITVTADNGSRTVRRGITITVYATESAFREFEMQTHLVQSLSTITPGMRGASMAVIDHSGSLHTAFAGDMGPDQTHLLLDKESMFRIASVTKPMTTALILKLVDDGLIGLDDILLDHYSTPLPNAGSMTFRQMLSHTAGVFDHLNSNAFWGHSSFTPTKVWSVDELVQFAVQDGPRFSPGTGYGYSNTAFCVLGAVVEEVTGLTLSEAYEQMLFEPMELEHIVYDDFSTASNTIPGLALNHRTYEYHLSAAAAAGAMAASPSDVASFGWQLYGGRYLSGSLTDAMSVNIGARHGGQNYGLGTRIWTAGGIRHHGHTGTLMNYRSILMYVPGSDLSIAIHAHDTHNNWFNLVDDLFVYVMENFDHAGMPPIADIREFSLERVEQYMTED